MMDYDRSTPTPSELGLLASPSMMESSSEPQEMNEKLINFDDAMNFDLKFFDSGLEEDDDGMVTTTPQEANTTEHNIQWDFSGATDKQNP